MGRQLEGKIKKHQRELAIMQNDLLCPQLAVNHSGLIFIFSLLLYSFHVMGFSFSKSFSAPRESPEILILRHDKKKKKKIKRKPEQPRKQGKTATTNNKFLGELLIVFFLFFFLLRPIFSLPLGCVKKITLTPSPNQWHTISSRQ